MKMLGTFNEVRYDKTFNKGNYENEKIGLTYAPHEQEDIFQAIDNLRKIVHGDAPITTATTPAGPVTVTATVEKKTTAKKDTTKKAAEEKSEKAEEAKAEVKAEEKAEEKVEEPKEEVKEKKKVMGKNTLYDRDNQNHKKLLSGFLDKASPNWKNPTMIKKALATSQKLHEEKTDFLDGEGNILDSFKDKFLAELGN